MTQISRSIEYAVWLQAPQTQTFEVRMHVRNIQSESLELALPVWRTGRYAVINPAGTVSRVRASGTGGKTLSVSKLDKTRWTVQTAGCSDIEICYCVYANSLSDRT